MEKLETLLDRHNVEWQVINFLKYYVKDIITFRPMILSIPIGRFAHMDQSIPWQTDHRFCWQTNAANAIAA